MDGVQSYGQAGKPFHTRLGLGAPMPSDSHQKDWVSEPKQGKDLEHHAVVARLVLALILRASPPL